MANSTSAAVVEAAVTAVTALGITHNAVPLPVVARKTPSVPEGSAAALPQIVISCGEEGRSEYLTATLKSKTYPVAVTIVAGTGQQLADDATVRQWRQQIELALEARTSWQTGSAAVSGWNRSTVTNKAPFDAGALRTDFNYSVVMCDVEVIEARG